MALCLPAALIGLGRMGLGYADDPAMARHFAYASHAQVLRDHPALDWRLAIDPAPAARAAAASEWNVAATAGDLRDLGAAATDIAVAVIATPPDARMAVFDALPNLRAVLVEKPLGRTPAEAQAFLAACAARGIMVQVNLWRRADRLFRELAAGQLAHLVGEIEVATGLYGNGLLNNGTHMVDFVRMLLGEVAAVHAAGAGPGFVEGPIPGDRNPAFALALSGGERVDVRPLRFGPWRDVGLDLWGTRGRLEILCEGLVVRASPVSNHRAATGEHEVAIDAPVMLPATCGTALWEMHDNLVQAVQADDPHLLVSPGSSALESARWVDRVLDVTADHG